MGQIKYMDVKEFREAGYLQELNRRFLHPLGLALEVQWKDATEEEEGHAAITGIWDYRDDPEGIRFELADDEFIEKAENIKALWHERKRDRVYSLGYMVQPYGEIDNEIGSDVVTLFADALAAEMNSVIPVQASSESWKKAARGILDKVTHKFSEETYEPSAVTPEEVHVMDLIVGNPSGKHSRAEALNMIIGDRDAYREMLETATGALAAIRDGETGELQAHECADVALSDIAGEMGG